MHDGDKNQINPSLSSQAKRSSKHLIFHACTHYGNPALRRVSKWFAKCLFSGTQQRSSLPNAKKTLGKKTLGKEALCRVFFFH
jgi:hypothetical protein